MSTITTTTRHLTTGGDGRSGLAELALPSPGPDEVQVRIAAATVNPVDLLTRAGIFHGAGRASGTVGLGWDLAGAVVELGAGVEAFAVGDPVIALRDDMRSPVGAHGEAINLPLRAVAPAPEGIEPVPASTIPLNALTALQALEGLDLAAGASLLVTGAAGAVGAFAVELAVARGLRVVAQASAGDADFLRRLGADEVLGRDALPTAPVDGALDAAQLGGRALAAVRDGGALVGVSEPATPAAERGIAVHTVQVQSRGDQLDQLARLAEQGRLTLRVADTYALAEADAAYERVAAVGVRGRVVLVA